MRRATFCLLIVSISAICSSASGQTSLEKRLAGLDPAEPLPYKLLAEELAARSDNESRATALRLFHIAAWLAPEELAAGAMRSMIAIARSSDEEKRFRAALFLLDPAAEPGVLRVAAAPPRHSGDQPPPAELLQALRQLRHGNRDAARQSLAKEPVRDYLAGEDQQPLRKELQAMFAANGLTGFRLRQLLELELAWTRAATESAGGLVQPVSTQPWSELGREALQSAPRSVTLLDLTEFDPRENVYRGEKWEGK